MYVCVYVSMNLQILSDLRELRASVMNEAIQFNQLQQQQQQQQQQQTKTSATTHRDGEVKEANEHEHHKRRTLVCLLFERMQKCAFTFTFTLYTYNYTRIYNYVIL